MAQFTLLANGLRGNFTSGSFTVPAGSPAHVKVSLTSPTFPIDPTLTFALEVEQSFNGGTDWENWFGSTSEGGTAGSIGKGGVINDGLPAQIVQFDGLTRLVRAVMTVPIPFIWGLTADILPT